MAVDQDRGKKNKKNPSETRLLSKKKKNNAETQLQQAIREQ